MPCKFRNNRRQGFVLVLTILVIAMVAILTVGFARFGLNKAVDSIRGESDLQMRWGAISCQRFVYTNHREILSSREWNDENQKWDLTPIRFAETVYRLGDQDFHVAVADESSKLNINLIDQKVSSQKTRQLIRRFALDSKLQVDLRQLKERNRRGPTEQAFGCWGQVFRGNQADDYFPIELMKATDMLTCWGQQVNYETAPDTVLLEACKLVVGPAIAARVVSFRDESDERSLDQFIEQVVSGEEQREELSRLLGNRSSAQSVWINVNCDNGLGSFFSVRETFAGSISRIYSFSW